MRLAQQVSLPADPSHWLHTLDNVFAMWENLLLHSSPTKKNLLDIFFTMRDLDSVLDSFMPTWHKLKSSETRELRLRKYPHVIGMKENLEDNFLLVFVIIVLDAVFVLFWRVFLFLGLFYGFCLFFKYQVAPVIRIQAWVFYFPLVYMSVFMPVPRCFYCWSSIISWNLQ